ncbi:MAG TPA: hypothetical protein VEL76_08190, partial [Gemmataceae bacterium]|nr:hypothetical protein [Gemmataceae bacterium]
LNKRFDMAISPTIFASMFRIEKILDSNVIAVEFDCKPEARDPAKQEEELKQAKKMVDALMDIHCKKAAADRTKLLQEAIKSVNQKLDAANKAYDDAVAARNKFLGKYKVIGDPKTEMDAITLRKGQQEGRLDEAKGKLQALLTEEKQLQERLKELERTEGEINAKGDPEDPDFKQRKRQAERDVTVAQQDLNKKRAQLKSKEASLPNTKKLAEDGLIEYRVLRQLENDIADLQLDVEAAAKILKLNELSLSELRPGNAKRIELLAKRRSLQTEQDIQRYLVNNYEDQLKRLTDRASELQTIVKDAGPYLSDVEGADLKKKGFGQRATDLSGRLGDVGSEIRVVGDGAVRAREFNDRTKKTFTGFVVPLLLCLAGMGAFEMSTKGWRAETMADRMDLPILARASGRGRRDGVVSLSANECRRLARRIKDALPDSGRVVLFSSLNEGVGVDRFVGEVGRFLGVGGETVLILDARIAHEQAEGMAKLIESRLDGTPPDVMPSAGESDLALAGLVQSLVFEGQKCTDFMYRTRIARVDYLPAGGPYELSDALASEPMDELLATLRQRYTLILMVGPSLSLDVDTEILAGKADGMIVVLNEPLSSYSPEVEGLVRSLREKQPSLLGSVICV